MTMETIGRRRLVLAVEHISLSEPGQAGAGEHTRAHFHLHGGQLVLARIDNLRRTRSLADAFSGVLPPSAGSVRFLGRDWRKVSADGSNAMRGKIGRVFSSGAWLDGFTVAENILLPMLHHTRKPENEIRREAVRLAEQFGLPGIPSGMPDRYTRADLQRAACVRAFLGDPALVLLEDPTFGIYPEVLPALVNAVRQVRDKGAAVFWMTLSNDVWTDRSIPADRLFRVSGRDLVEASVKI